MEHAEPRIRPFEGGDADAVVSLSLRAWAPVFVSIERAMGSEIYSRLTPDWRASQKQSVEDVCASEKTRVWVAEVDEIAVGFVAVEIRHDDGFGEIYMLAVDTEYQGGGIGSTLTDFAFDRIRESGMEVAMVETGADPGHAAARRTYEKAGCVQLPIARYFKKL
ncbi:GNAT family N-acetyltransferase [soil metagenome]